MSRHRRKHIEQMYKSGVTGEIRRSLVCMESMLESHYPGSCAVSHAQSPPTSFSVPVTGHSPDTYSNFCTSLADVSHSDWSAIRSAVSKSLTQLDWQKLPSSSQFSIINFIAELDETLLMFTRRFWRQLSYGSLTWGVMPFVSDLRALLQTIRNVRAGLQSFAYEASHDCPIEKLRIDHTVCTHSIVSGNVRVHHVGHCKVAEDSQLQQWIDVLGFHPDLATAWDLLPLSFVVDYFLPIGSYLESFRSGWLSSVPFGGWSSAKYTLVVEFHSTPPCYNSDIVSTRSQLSRFDRWYGMDTLTVQTGGFTWEGPSITELFNTLYIYKKSRRN